MESINKIGRILMVEDDAKDVERDCNGFMPQSAVYVADPSFIGLQIKNHDLAEARRNA
jgi:hypothetical protein